MSGANTYSGSTNISNATLQIGAINALPITTNININSGVLNLHTGGIDYSQEVASVSGEGGNVILGLLGSSALTITSASPTVYLYTGLISGAGKLVMNSAGELDLPSPNTYAGGTLFERGTIGVGSGSSLGTGLVTVSGSPVLACFSSIAIQNSLTISSGSDLTVNTNANIDTLGADIGGSGAITKTGSGTLILTGANSFTTTGAGLNVMAGTLQGTTDSLDANQITNNGTLNFNQTTLGAYPGTISGTGAIDVNGGGSVTFPGTNTAPAGTVITNAQAVINGVLNSPVTVNPLGVLKGVGTINGNITVNGGTFAPGNSPGTMTMTGVLNIGPSPSAYEVEADPTVASLTHVIGTANISPTAILQVTFDAGAYPIPYSQPIIATTGGVAGTFGIVNPINLPSNAVLKINYTPDDVFLQLLGIIPPLPPGIPGTVINQINYINNFGNQTLINLLSVLNVNQLSAAMNSIFPARNAISGFAAANVVFMLGDLMHGNSWQYPRLKDVKKRRSTPAVSYTALNDAIDHEEEFLATARRPQSYIKKSSCPPQSFNYSFWVDGFGDWSHQKSYKTTPSFDVSTRGALLGFEYFAEIGLVETAFAYAHSDSKLGMPSGHGSTDYYCGSVYWTVYPWDTAYLEVGIWGVYNTFKNTREISFPGFHTTSRSAHHGWQLMPHLSFGYDFVYDWAVLQPFVTLDWDFIHQSGFKEHGGAYVNFRERASTASVLRSQIGLSGYEIVKQTNEWTVIIKETLSAVNRDPFHLGKAKANLAGSSAWISLNEPFASQYLFAPLLELYVKHSSGVYADITYRGEFGSGYRTNGGYVQVGAFF